MKDNITLRLLTLAASHLRRAADDLEAARSPQLAAECDDLRRRVLKMRDAATELTEEDHARYVEYTAIILQEFED